MDKRRLEERRAFNEALRTRLRLIATERDLPDTEVKFLGRLRHQDLVDFVRKHKLSFERAASNGAEVTMKRRRRTARKRNRQRLASHARRLRR
jgi:hypothetical protein